MTSNPNTNPTNADDTPPAPNRWAALDTIAFRVRSSWWAPWACATQAGFLAGFAYGAPQGEPGIALLPYAAAGLALAIPANARRAGRGLATLPAALRARRAYAEHAATPAAGLRGRASRLRRGMTGQTWRTPRIATITRGQGGALILLVENLPDIDADQRHVVFGGAGNLWGAFAAAFTLGIANKMLEPWAGAVLAKILILVFIILFIQKRPRGLFPQRGRAVDA